jgi:shikimate kinase
MNNIVLIGYRGTGKTHVALLLAAALNRSAISSDEEIIRREGRLIPEIVEIEDWDYFRDVESRVVADLASQSGLVLDTGGGAILREKNRRALCKSGRIVWLKATPETIRARIAKDGQRPSLTGKSFLDEITDVLSEREPIYREMAEYEIDTDDLTPREISDRIITWWNALAQ